MSLVIDEGELRELGAHMASALSDAVIQTRFAYGDLTLEVKPERILDTLKLARDDSQCRFESLIDICGVDFPSRPERFEIVYHLLSMRMNKRVRIKASIAEGQAMPSATGLFRAANWFEREVFDMYGVPFSGHPDMRRILTDYGFEGYPLRKDFPLSGHVQVRYDVDEGRVVREPVKLVQDYRDFDFLSPWEGIRDILPDSSIPNDPKQDASDHG